MNKDLIEKTHHQTFESLKQEGEDGCEFWSARKLAKALEYSEYRHFLPVIGRAKEACKNSGHNIVDHFEDILDMMCDRYVAILEGESPSRALVRRTVREGKGVHREVESEESRIQNADLTNRKRIEAMALGQGRFIVQSPILTQKGPCRCDRLAGKCSELPGESCTPA